jgi:hypothetical protein
MLIEYTSDIWDHWFAGNWIVITTNVGWKSDGTNPMGAGIAKKAAELVPGLARWYGDHCQKERENTGVALFLPARLVLFPTKAFNPEAPHLSWKAKSNIDLIKRSAEQLQQLRKEMSNVVGLPMVGCQNGGLSPDVVMPALAERLDDSFVLYLGWKQE